LNRGGIYFIRVDLDCAFGGEHSIYENTITSARFKDA
jgi:hypothetical protein